MGEKQKTPSIEGQYSVCRYYIQKTIQEQIIQNSINTVKWNDSNSRHKKQHFNCTVLGCCIICNDQTMAS